MAGQSDAKTQSKTTTAPPPAAPKGPRPLWLWLLLWFRLVLAGRVLEITWRVIAPLHMKSIDQQFDIQK
eukprot:11806765-Heterocapsa_arctica.AAC.1